METLEHYKYVVKHHNLLILGNNKLEKFDTIFKEFKNNYSLESTPYNIENLSATFVELDISTIIITDVENHQEICNHLKAIMQAPRHINIIICYLSTQVNINEDLINMSDTVFTPNITLTDLAGKIFNSINEVLATSAISVNFDATQNYQEKYKDEFDLEVMYLSEELKDIAFSIDSGDVGEDIMKRLEKAIENVATIMKDFLIISKKVETLVYELDEYLKNFNLEVVDMSTIEGFEHLARLTEDISVFMDMYFISKEIKDIYIIEDSLTNSFEYVKLVFSGEQNSDNDSDGSELEFF
jgi:hypothetical protein